MVIVLYIEPWERYKEKVLKEKYLYAFLGRGLKNSLHRSIPIALQKSTIFQCLPFEVV